MTAHQLQALLEPEFEASLPATSNGQALRLALIGNGVVGALADAVHAGAITESDLIGFGEEIGLGFQRGHQLPHGLALAAVAVVLSERYGPAAVRFVTQLSEIRHPEFRDPVSVARACLEKTYGSSRTVIRDFGTVTDSWDPEEREYTATSGLELLEDAC